MISMLGLNIGSDKLSSCMLRIGLGPKAVQGKGGGCPPLPCSHLGPRPMLSMHELSLPEPMLSLSMMILATMYVISCCCVGRHHWKPKSKLTSPNFNMLTFGDFA